MHSADNNFNGILLLLMILITANAHAIFVPVYHRIPVMANIDAAPLVLEFFAGRTVVYRCLDIDFIATFSDDAKYVSIKNVGHFVLTAIDEEKSTYISLEQYWILRGHLVLVMNSITSNASYFRLDGVGCKEIKNPANPALNQ